MTTANTGWIREAWLVMAYGGWWTSERLAATMDIEKLSHQYHVALRFMTRCGYIEKRPTGKGRGVEYAVTERCIIPPRISIREYEHARGVRVKQLDAQLLQPDLFDTAKERVLQQA